MFGELTKKAVSSVLSMALIFQSTIGNVYAANPNTASRLDWNVVETNTSISGVPSNLKYFQYYDVLPDDITMPIYKNMNLSTVAGKKLFVGYGTVDPDGTMCRYFPELGRSECLPWWRIEREYAVPDTNSTSATDFLKNLTMLYPPKNIQYCKEWKTNEQLDGGKVTCTSYYDKRKSVDCLANPEQSACYVDQCSNGIKTACTLVGSETGDTKTLQRPMVGNAGIPVGIDMITGLKSHQYNCPAGYMPGKECNDWVYGVTYPYECKAPTSVAANDGEYIYCDTNPLPYYDNTGTLAGFTSNDKCADGSAMDGATGTNGKQRMCPVNSYSQTQKVCTDPIVKVESNIASQTINQKRSFKDYETSVLFGDEVGDIYSGDTMCLRLNTVEGARQKNITTHIVGNGNLDDDIYVIAHKANASYNKIYCNMQHNENSSGTAKKWIYNFSGYQSTGSKTITATLTLDTGEVSNIVKNIQVVSNGGMNNSGIDLSATGAMSIDKNTSIAVSVFSNAVTAKVTFDFGDMIQHNGALDSSSVSMVNKNYAGDTLQCIDNDGNYNFDQHVTISSSDVISIQEASEAENATKEYMFARNHFRATPVSVDGVNAAPGTFPTNYPAYPTHGGLFLKTWDNALTNLSIMFPFAGAYDIFVYGGGSEYENRLIGSATLTIEDFKDMPNNGYIQLKLGKSMVLSPGMVEGNTSNACREDDLVDWGGGVWASPNGSKGNLSGCSSPDDSHAKANSAYNIVVKDLLTGTVTPIKLVYPLPYPNRIFVSKLNIVENRKYRCYDPFPDVSAGTGCIIGAQNESNPISDYRGASVNMMRASTFYCDVTSEKVVGCNNEKTVQNDGGIVYQNSNQYETIDNSGMFMNALAGVQLSEQMMHIWSGWPGECEHGTFTDFSWTSDPMTLASLAMSAYGSAVAGADEASAAKTTADAAQDTADAAQIAVDVAVATGDATTIAAAADELISATTKLADAVAKADYWAQSLGNTLKFIVDNAIGEVTSNLTKIAVTAVGDVGSMIEGTGLDTIVTYATETYSNTIGISTTIADKTAYMNNLGDAYAVADNAEQAASIAAEIAKTAAEITDLTASTAGQALTNIQTITKPFGDLFTNPATADGSNMAIQNASVVEQTETKVTDLKSFLTRMKEMNQIKDVGFTVINWTDIAAAGYQMYANVAASRDDMIKAWKAQQAYVLSGEGTNNDIASNAYASCMASVGSNFVNTISIAGGANDANATSQELLTPWHNPMRISLQSLYELRSIVGDQFMEVSYRAMDIDYNMQMITIVALNGTAYNQLTQLVCGGYNVATVANAVNQAAANKPGIIDGLKNMDGKQKAMMAASMACALAGPWAFACSLALKLFSSFTSGNACTDEKIAQSQKPIQLKTNKFQKFGQCHHTGGSCSKKMLGGCSLHKEKYCCYDQIMTRIFAEGVKAQRGTGWNSCNDITINDLKDISFTPCTPEQDPYTDKCFPVASYRELNNELKKQIKKGLAVDGDTFMSQVQNAMEVTQ